MASAQHTNHQEIWRPEVVPANPNHQLDAMIAKLNELGYDVGCKIYDGCLVRRKQHSKLPQRVITACEEHIEAETGLKMRLWEKCLLCGEKLAACTCANAQEPCLDCGETFARCMCDGQ